jgi:hypothetical protein
VSWIFVSHSSADWREAAALKRWLGEQDPPLAHEIFLDQPSASGAATAGRWKDELFKATAGCAAVICVSSRRWESSNACVADYRAAEATGKQIFVARLEPSTDSGISGGWQRCDLFGDSHRTPVAIGDATPVMLASEGLYQLRDGIRGAGIGAGSFVWPPPGQPDRDPYRGWRPFTEADAGVFFGRDTQIVRAVDALLALRQSARKALFVVVGPPGSGKSSFLRAGLLPRLRRDDRRFVLLELVRPERYPLTGDTGLAHAIHAGRCRLGLQQPTLAEINTVCTSGDAARVRALVVEVQRAAAARLPRPDPEGELPTVVLPLDQAEELFTAHPGDEASGFLRLLSRLVDPGADGEGSGLIVAATIGADHYGIMQTAPELAELDSVRFGDLTPMSASQIKEVITGPAARATEAGHALRVESALLDQLVADATADTVGSGGTLPLLALTLSRLVSDHGSGGTLTLAHYEQMDGMRRVVNTEIDKILSADRTQRHAQLEQLRAAFIPRLVTFNAENHQPLPQLARWSDLPEVSRPLLDALVAKQLLLKERRGRPDRAAGGQVGEVVVEIAHESLLSHWDELAGWLARQRQNLVTANDLQRHAAAWEADNHEPRRLLSGTRLIEAETLADTTEFHDRLTHTRGYLTASRRKENIRLETENQRYRADLRAVREHLEAAEARALAAIQARDKAEEDALALRKRASILLVVLVVTAVVAVAALIAATVA